MHQPVKFLRRVNVRTTHVCLWNSSLTLVTCKLSIDNNKLLLNFILSIGLFTADKDLSRSRKHTSIYTRQNPKGTRYGFECPEERDYYPYWHPTDWIDIAVLVDKKADCSYYLAESFNVKPKGEYMQAWQG